MKKSNLVAMMLGTVSGMLFAIGMCMVLLPEWNAMKIGIVFGGVGIALGIITLIVWRKMEHKAPVRFSGKTMFTAGIAIIGSLALGVGMCLCLVWEKMLVGIIVGILGIAVLLTLIPLIKGIKE